VTKQYTSRLIIYTLFREEKKYLLIKDSYDNWNFFKSKIQSNETQTKKLINQIESKLKLIQYEFVPGFQKNKKFTFSYESEYVTKTVSWYIVLSHDKDLAKNINCVWLPFLKAKQKLQNFYDKNILKEVDKFLDIPRLI